MGILKFIGIFMPIAFLLGACGGSGGIKKSGVGSSSSLSVSSTSTAAISSSSFASQSSSASSLSSCSNSCLPEVISLENTGFESQLSDGWSQWATSSDVITRQSSGFSGAYSLLISSAVAYQADISQTKSGLVNSYYTLTAMVKNGGGQKSAYLYAKNCGGQNKMTSLPVSESWLRVTVRGIAVTSGQCTLGVWADANGGNWLGIDDVKLVKDDISYNFLQGGDISELNYVESKGAKFFESGVQKDSVKILADNGFNFVRVRAFNDPGNPNYSQSNKLPPGFQTTADILSLAARAHAKGMKIQLTLNYSDFWADGSMQDTPHEWIGMNLLETKTALYNYTFDIVKRLVEQGTPPEFVSLGNQMQMGILRSPVNLGGYENWSQLAQLLNAGYDAVKAAAPAAKVMLHTSSPNDEWFFDAAVSNGVHFDVIGMSWYPFWEKDHAAFDTLPELLDALNRITAKFNKDVVIMEVGVPFSPLLSTGWPGQLSTNGQVSYPLSPEGQRDFMYDLINVLKSVNNGRCLGVLYWDPVMVNQDGVGWIVGGPNVVDNTTLFDWSHNAQPALTQAYKFNN